MPLYHLILFLVWTVVSLSCFLSVDSSSCCLDDFLRQSDRQFERKTDRFWEFQEESNTWVEVKLPYDLISCVDNNCTKVGLIDQSRKDVEQDVVPEQKESLEEESSDVVLPVRKRISLTKMSETSIWVTGESGCIYERFWNGLQWVIAPHDLPLSAGHAISVFVVNQTILALSETGVLYQMQLNEKSQPVWGEFMPILDQSTTKEAEKSFIKLIKSGVVSHDLERVLFCTKRGSLLELKEIEPPRWIDHGRPPGANVAAIADAETIRTEVLYIISSAGDLYEYDRNSKPSWKKHIGREGLAYDSSLIPTIGCSLRGLIGDQSTSLFLLTKGGNLVERRLHGRKWKWIFHGRPKGHYLSSITPVLQDESNTRIFTLLLTTSVGFVFEYRIPKYSGTVKETENSEAWISHKHPPHAKVARTISGLQYQIGRTLFMLDDGRIAELHLSGLGGENSGPNHQINIRKKASMKYLWSILGAPETEGWNAEYCTEERGPTNCITGIKDEPSDSGVTKSIKRRRKGSQSQQNYLFPASSGTGLMMSQEEYKHPENWISTNFRLRAMYGGRSLFLVTDSGLFFERLYTENVWLWLRHESPIAIRGALGNYNGSLFLVDIYGSLQIRERNGSELTWINCTAMRKGRKVIGGPPWDAIPGKDVKVTSEDAIFFVSQNGRLLQFTVALRKFKWKDCKNPPSTKVSSIVDQELFRENIVFVVGRNGRLYQYNKVTELWHEHYQSQHLVLSRVPGTAMRSSSLSLTGSLFMLSEDGGLVEYHWNSLDGWNWVEHGTPHREVTLVGSPSPCFEGNTLFLIGSDGKVYLRYMEQMTWRWKNCGFPSQGQMNVEDQRQAEAANMNEAVCTDEDKPNDISKNCDPKVSSTRPIPFSEDSVIFELQDGRLAEMRRGEDSQWTWSLTISTPTSLCQENYWTAMAS